MARSPEIAAGSALSEAHELPEVAFTRSGLAFRPNEDVWHWRDGPFPVHLDFRRLSLPATVPTDSLKYTLYVFAKRNSPAHVTNLFNAFVHFLAQRRSDGPLNTISVSEVANYIARLGAHEKWRVGTLNVLLQKWAALGLAGVDAECTRYLRERRKPGNPKGTAVRQRDPVEGPFSEEEYTALYKAVDAAYGAGEIPLWVIVLARLLFACGGRISQYASLKLSDFKAESSQFILNLPQAKTGLAHARASFVEFRLSPQTGRLLLEHIERHRADGLESDAPLFPESEVLLKGEVANAYPANDPFRGHCTRDALSRNFNGAMSAIAPLTSRLDFAPLPVTSKRFRSTFGTRLAEEGAGRAEIAERLGHVDLQNVDVYFEASPIIVENIDKAMGRQLAPLARAFRGRLVEDEEHSTHKGAPGSRIIDFRVSSKPLASCAGKAQGCGFNKPVACYTCFKFEPWLDGPHEKVLKRLEEERAQWAQDERMAAINDEAIEAVREVIAECAQVRAQQCAEGTA
jgi:integrase